MNRQLLLWVIIILASATTMMQYAVQGAMAANHNPADFHIYFWYADFALWALRAIIEAVCVAYLFTTVANTRFDKWWLAITETTMLATIAFTLGVVYRALGQNKLVYQVVDTDFYVLWTYAIGVYPAIMMGSAGIAYRIQPIATGQQMVNAADVEAIEALQLRNEELQQDIKLLRQSNEELQLDNQRSQVWQRLSQSAKAKIAVDDIGNQNGNGVEFERLARQEIGTQAVSRAKKGN